VTLCIPCSISWAAAASQALLWLPVVGLLARWPADRLACWPVVCVWLVVLSNALEAQSDLCACCFIYVVVMV